MHSIVIRCALLWHHASRSRASLQFSQHICINAAAKLTSIRETTAQSTPKVKCVHAQKIRADQCLGMEHNMFAFICFNKIPVGACTPSSSIKKVSFDLSHVRQMFAIPSSSFCRLPTWHGEFHLNSMHTCFQ